MMLELLKASAIGFGYSYATTHRGEIRLIYQLRDRDNLAPPYGSTIYLNGRTVRLLKDGVEYGTQITGQIYPSQGEAEWQFNLPEGTYTFECVFDGDAEYLPSTSGVFTWDTHDTPVIPPDYSFLWVLASALAGLGLTILGT